MNHAKHLNSLGFALWVEGDILLVAPASQLTASERMFIRQHKAEILAELAANDAKAMPSETRTTMAANQRSLEWHLSRDSFYNHWFSCKECRPSGRCAEGERLFGFYGEMSNELVH